jgi:hypothetical protein
MNEREQILTRAAAAIDRLHALGQELVAAGWRPEIIVFAPSELPRIVGYKVALVLPVDMTWSTSTDLVPVPTGLEARCECGTRLEWSPYLLAYSAHACIRQFRAVA